MSLYSSLFIFQFLVVILITLVKFYNILSGNKKAEEGKTFPYDIKISFILFAATLVLYGVGLMISIYMYDEYLYIILFQIERFILPVNILFFIIELIYRLKDTALKTIEAHKSRDTKRSFFNG